MQTYILGWGSLLWDADPNFDESHEAWQYYGPEIYIEFSRISQKRSGALTLVIDQINGSKCTVAYTKSKHADPACAIEDLRIRENTSKANIGIYFTDGTSRQTRNPEALLSIEAWSKSKNIDAIIWTDLQPNFQKKLNRPFSTKNAINYLKTLDKEGIQKAVEYINQAPAFIDTSFRRSFESLSFKINNN